MAPWPHVPHAFPVPLSRSEECPFCVDAPVKENGKKCVGVCRNPQNVPGEWILSGQR